MAYNPGYNQGPPGYYAPPGPGPQFGGPPTFPPGPPGAGGMYPSIGQVPPPEATAPPAGGYAPPPGGYAPPPGGYAPPPGGYAPPPGGFVPPPDHPVGSCTGPPLPGQPYEPPNAPPVYNPALPYIGPLPTLRDGHMVIVRGFIPVVAKDFHINLSVGAGTNGAVDNALHLKPCFSEKLNEIVRNNYAYGQWGGEEKWGESPMTAGENFECIILVTDAHYRVAANGNHFCEFNHRLPKESVTHLVIGGDVLVNSIHVQTPVAAPPPVSQPPPPYVPEPAIPPPVQPVEPPPVAVPPEPEYLLPVPYQHKIPGGIRPHLQVKILGRVNNDAHRFAVEFCYFAHNKRDIPFHFNPRFDETMVVRNTMNGTKWGREERAHPQFPFGRGCPFEITIKIKEKKYKVKVDGNDFIEYTHRLSNFPKTDHLLISGDIQLAHVSVHLSQD